MNRVNTDFDFNIHTECTMGEITNLFGREDEVLLGCDLSMELKSISLDDKNYFEDKFKEMLEERTRQKELKDAIERIDMLEKEIEKSKRKHLLLLSKIKNDRIKASLSTRKR